MKYQKLAKFQKLSKLKKSKSEKLWKSGNSLNFNAIEAGSSISNYNAKIAFNYLWLAFIKAPIFAILI